MINPEFIQHILNLHAKLEFHNDCLWFCVLEIKSSKIESVEQAIHVVKKASKVLDGFCSKLEINSVLDKVKGIFDDFGITKALNKAGVKFDFEPDYQSIVARVIYTYKTQSLESTDKSAWMELSKLINRDKDNSAYKKYGIYSDILLSLYNYLSEKDRSSKIQAEIELLEEYIKKLEGLYSYHSDPAFKRFASPVKGSRAIVAEGAFSTNAVALEISKLRAKLITKRKDSTMLERQLALDVMDALHKRKAKKIPAAVGIIMNSSFVKEFLDNRTIFRLWKSYHSSLVQAEEYYGVSGRMKRTITYEHAYGESSTTLYESARKVSLEFIREVGL